MLGEGQPFDKEAARRKAKSEFSNQTRLDLDEIGHHADSVFSLRESWQGLVREKVGKPITAIDGDTGQETCIGAIFPVSSTKHNDRHIVVLNNGKLFEIGAKNQFEKNIYLENVARSRRSLEVFVPVSGASLSEAATASLRQEFLERHNIQVVRSSDNEKDLQSLVSVTEKVWRAIDQNRKKREAQRESYIAREVSVFARSIADYESRRIGRP